LPISHGEGNYICDAETLEGLRSGEAGKVILRYCAEDGGELDAAPNGALDNIAGISNVRGNVFGLMPHPERVIDPVAASNTDGTAFFATLAARLVEVNA
jgi:phosphoribosylformylglycinamidine synthase